MTRLRTMFAPSPRKSGRPGFSFIEVLFAIMILGIGFIMIAGVFPVGLKQTAETKDENIGMLLARSAVTSVSSVPNLQNIANLPNNGECVALSDYPWAAIKGNQIYKEDPRYGWIALLKRDVTDYRGQIPNSATLVVVPVLLANPDQSRFGPADLVQNGSGPNSMGNLKALPIRAQLFEGANAADRVVLSGANIGAAAPGAVIILRNGSDVSGRNAAGRAYRLGEPVAGSTTEFELLAGNDLAIVDSNREATSAAVDAWIVGRGMTAPGSATNAFSGDSMAIGVYTTFISLR